MYPSALNAVDILPDHIAWHYAPMDPSRCLCAGCLLYNNGELPLQLLDVAEGPECYTNSSTRLQRALQSANRVGFVYVGSGRLDVQQCSCNVECHCQIIFINRFWLNAGTAPSLSPGVLAGFCHLSESVREFFLG